MDMQLLYSNCVEQEFFFNLFSVSNCKTSIHEYFSHASAPLITSDSTGFVWVAVLQSGEENKQVPVIHMLGPMFTSTMTLQYLNQHIHKLHPSMNLESRLMRSIQLIPEISYDIASRYATLLHYCVNGISIQPAEVELWSERTEQVENISWGTSGWHGDVTLEQRFSKSISEGRYVDLKSVYNGTLGNIGGGDPLRQAKNMFIVFVVICSRAAIKGGISVEGSLSLSDYFIQRAEAEKTVSAVEALGTEMYRTYIQRVQKSQNNRQYSPLVRACAEYVETHVFERIQLKDIASSVGYTKHYISHKYKEETGNNLFDFINETKIEYAKELLQTSTISISELSDRLGFASPSYFSSIFKKFAGMSPIDYQKNVNVISPDVS